MYQLIVSAYDEDTCKTGQRILEVTSQDCREILERLQKYVGQEGVLAGVIRDIDRLPSPAFSAGQKGIVFYSRKAA